MNNKWTSFLLVALVLALVGMLCWLATWPSAASSNHLTITEGGHRANPTARSTVEKVLGEDSLESAKREARGMIKAKLRDRLQRRGSRPNEGVLTFKDQDAYQKFLARAAQADIRITGKIDALSTVRVRTESLDALTNDFLNNATDYGEVAANYYMGPPTATPAAQERAARIQVPLGNNLLPFLGVAGDTQNWGRGVTIAVLDSGVSADATFGTGRLQTLDIGLGSAPSHDQEGGHGTAVAALAAGLSPDAQGVAPASNILSIRVADDGGKSDIFTVSQGIVAAVDAGARILNISLGGYATTDTLTRAIDYASAHGAVIVAAAGNDQAAQLTWPAADPRVVSVGAVDALEQQVIFSNSGSQLQITAPGYGVQTAWTDGLRIFMDGTSASAPIVSGAIAAIMSQSPGISALEAWQVLQHYASDGGPPGTDPDYGHGVLNLGWAMARNDPTHVDTAVSSHYYNESTSTMEIVVQNRSAQAVSGLSLDVATTGSSNRYPIQWLNPGATQVIQIPVDRAMLAAQGGLQFVTQLNNPSGLVDQVPSNNRKISSLTPPSHPTPAPSPSPPKS